MSIATQILIFAATALGLNIVVGLAGLLDLGYIAFLGAGAYVGGHALGLGLLHRRLAPAVRRRHARRRPAAAATFGLIIGTPTLRVSGDYLAIVTLGFGEIFRLADDQPRRQQRPRPHQRPQRHPGDPRPGALRLRLRRRRTPSPGIPLGRFANYYFLLLLLLVFVILVFVRLNNSRIGRGWVAIREDEKAAEAMGVNVFGLKLLAFAGRRVPRRRSPARSRPTRTSRSPRTSTSSSSRRSCSRRSCSAVWAPSSACSSAPRILKLLPEKLRFVSDYRLLHLRPAARPHDAVPARGPGRRTSAASWSSTKRTTELVELVQARAPPGGEMTVTETQADASAAGVAPAGPRGQRRHHAVRRPHRRRRRRA